MTGRLEGKVAIVTGASSGIGRAALERFAAEGARVVAVSRSKDKLEAAQEAVRAAGGECAIAPNDLSTQDGADAAVQAAVDAFGGVDVLVNNAGVGYSYRESRPKSMEPIADSPPDEWDNVMAINLGSVVHCIRAVLPLMRQAGLVARCPTNALIARSSSTSSIETSRPSKEIPTMVTPSMSRTEPTRASPR